MEESGTLIGHYACPREACGSSDALAIYRKETPNGGEKHDGFCWSCERHFKRINMDDAIPAPEEEHQDKEKKFEKVDLEEIKGLPIKSLADRGIREAVAEHYGVRVGFDAQTGEISHHYYPYKVDGKLTGYKERNIEKKEFHSVGNTRNCELFGQHLFGKGGRMLVITEGEPDAMAAYQMFKSLNKSYSVVSLPQGANIRGLKNNLEYVESFEKVVLSFDQDKVGQQAAEKAAQLLSPGKAFIMSMEEKDANKMLQEHKAKEFFQSLNSAREYRPDGIIRLSDSWDELWKNENVKSVPYPWEGLNDKLYGMRQGELVTLTSGSGMGKSAVVKELEYHLFRETEDNIGILHLEENIGKTDWGLMSVHASLPLHIREHRRDVPKEDIRRYFDETVGTGRFIAYDHFGSTAADNLISQVRYLIKGMDCKWIFLDHLSIVVSSMEEGGDERKTIDDIMTRLRTLVEETGVGLFLVSHLKRPSGDKGHERGGEVSLSQLRGSHSIAQLSDAVIGLERNGQDENEKVANLTKARVIKNRYSGLVGLATHLYYKRETGRLTEIDDVEAFIVNDEGLDF